MHLTGKWENVSSRYLSKILFKVEKFLKDSNWKPQLVIIEKACGESETYSEPSETSKMKLFAEIVDCIQPLTIFAKHFSLGVSQGYEYASD